MPSQDPPSNDQQRPPGSETDTPVDIDPTILIDESLTGDSAPRGSGPSQAGGGAGYSVRPRQGSDTPAPSEEDSSSGTTPPRADAGATLADGGETGSGAPSPVGASDSLQEGDTVEVDEEDVLVLLSDEEYEACEPVGDDGDAGGAPRLVSALDQATAPPQRAEEVGLLTSHPGEDFGDLADETEVEVDELPELEDVEDITAFVEDESDQLQAPAEEPIAALGQARGSRRRIPWFFMASAAAALIAAILYGPQIYHSYVAPEDDHIARAADPPAPLPDPSGPDVGSAPDDPAGGTENATGGENADPAPGTDVEGFESWLAEAVAENLSVGTATPIDANPAPSSTPPAQTANPERSQ